MPLQTSWNTPLKKEKKKIFFPSFIFPSKILGKLRTQSEGPRVSQHYLISVPPTTPLNTTFLGWLHTSVSVPFSTRTQSSKRTREAGSLALLHVSCLAHTLWLLAGTPSNRGNPHVLDFLVPFLNLILLPTAQTFFVHYKVPHPHYTDLSTRL